MANFTDDFNETVVSNVTKGSLGSIVQGEVDSRALTPDQYDDLVKVVYFWIQGVVYTVVCSIGIVANIMNIITLWRQRYLVTYKIFLCMACADLMVVAVMLSYSVSFCLYSPVKIVLIKDPPALTHPHSLYVWFRIWYHIQNTFMCISTWCVVLVAIFRLIVISFPLRAVEYASTLRVNISIMIVFIGSTLIQIPMYLDHRWSDNGAAVPVDMSKYQMMTLVLISPLPLFLCALSTIILIIQLKRQQKKMSAHVKKEQMADRLKDHRQMTITLLFVLLFFIVTNTPDVTYWIMIKLNSFERFGISEYNKNIFYLLATVFNALNYSGNFFIYILANSSFRKDFKLVINKCLNRSPAVNTSNSTRITSMSENQSHHGHHQELSSVHKL